MTFNPRVFLLYLQMTWDLDSLFFVFIFSLTVYCAYAFVMAYARNVPRGSCVEAPEEYSVQR